MIAGEYEYLNTEAPFPGTRLSKSWGEMRSLSSLYSIETGELIENRFVDMSPGNTIRMYISFREQSIVLSIRQLYSMLRTSKEDVLAILKQYIKTNEVINTIKKLKFLDLGKLASLIIWLTNVLNLKVTSINLIEDLETGRPQFIGIYIEECGWDEWKILSKTVKKQLVNEGLNDVARQVALICRQALGAPRS